MVDLLKKFDSWEPLRANRWVITIDGTTQKIPEWMIKDFKLESVLIKDRWEKQKNGLKLTIHLYNSVHCLIVPDDVMDASTIKLQFLDPTGVEVNHYNMKVELDKMILVGDYSSDDILTHEISFWVKDLKSLWLNDDLVVETFENYKKNKEAEVK